MRPCLPLLSAACLVACAAPVPQGLGLTPDGAGPKVTFDVLARPLPEIPLPNDFASRFDATSPTLHRVNASIEEAPTRWEKGTRAGLDQMSGWGTLAPITVSFDAPLDLENILRRHQRPADTGDDALYVIDVTRTSPDFCKPVLLDLGQGHFPVVLDDPQYYPDEPHDLQTLAFEQAEEDLDGDGVLDPGEDTDMDGVLDHPNTLDGKTGPFDVIGFYEKETNTLIARPLYPMRESTTYAVVLTTPPDGQGRAAGALALRQHQPPRADARAPAAQPSASTRPTWRWTTWPSPGRSPPSHSPSTTARFRDGLYGPGRWRS